MFLNLKNMITRRYNISLTKQKFEEVFIPTEPARISLTLDSPSDINVGTDKITAENEILHIGPWHFIMPTLFCRNTEAEGLRIDISAVSLADKNRYDFYLIDNYVENKPCLLDAFMELIVAIAHNDTVKDFDERNDGTNIRRLV